MPGYSGKLRVFAGGTLDLNGSSLTRTRDGSAYHQYAAALPRATQYPWSRRQRQISGTCGLRLAISRLREHDPGNPPWRHGLQAEASASNTQRAAGRMIISTDSKH